MDKEFIIMSQKEVKRYDVIKKVINKEINGSNAAEILDLSTRQIRRLKVKVEENGIQGLAHASRGKPGNRKIPDREKQNIINLLHQKYSDFGPTFASEKLEEKHKIIHDPKTIRTIMIEEQLWKPKKRKKEQYHCWRQRRTNYGEMQQYDGSYHEWFEDRGPKCCLLAAIDDATSKVEAKFDQHEGVNPTFNFWEQYIKKYGKPHSIYVDKFSTYSMNDKLAKENPDTLTQFQRAMRQLNIEVINAHSSQAKGRVENIFGTLQDRLVKELRLNNISTILEANEFLEKEFLPIFNARFNVEPKGKANMHVKPTRQETAELKVIFSRHTPRTIHNDFTISYKNAWYQLVENQPITIFKGEVVIVEERRDETIYLQLRGKHLVYKKLPIKPRKISEKTMPWVLAKQSHHKPAASHPWRTYNNLYTNLNAQNGHF